MTHIYRTLLRAVVPCACLALAPLLLQCGADARTGTETGSPGILLQNLYLEVTASGLRIVGRAGSITPPNGRLRATNLRTGATVEATVATDGSLDVEVPGEPGDEVQVTVTAGGVEVSESLSFAEIARRPDPGGVSCLGLEHTLNRVLNDVFESADKSCATAADCVEVGWRATCYQGCGVAPLSRTGASEAQTLGTQLTAPVCAALEACEREPPPTCRGGPDFQVTLCDAGQCISLAPSELTCEQLVTAASEHRATLLASADRACSVDSDCALASTSARCLVSCGPGTSVARSAAQTLENQIQNDVDIALCQPAINGGCDYEMAGCPEPPGPPESFCDSGTCAIRYGAP